MERDFRYLRDKHGDAGARDIFEKICTELFYAQYGERAHNIRVSQGDGGIDVLIGDFSEPIINFQCKFFLDGIGNVQKAQIRDSFMTSVNSSLYQMEKWVLCVPCTLSTSEFEWWGGWRTKQEKVYGIDIALYEGGYLISQLKKYDIYQTTFDDDIRGKLDQILAYIEAGHTRRANDLDEPRWMQNMMKGNFLEVGIIEDNTLIDTYESIKTTLPLECWEATRELLMELHLNATDHGKAERVMLHIERNHIAILDNGHKFDSRSLLKKVGFSGGSWTMKEYFSRYSDVVIDYEYAEGWNKSTLKFKGEVFSVNRLCEIIMLTEYLPRCMPCVLRYPDCKAKCYYVDFSKYERAIRLFCMSVAIGMTDGLNRLIMFSDCLDARVVIHIPETEDGRWNSVVRKLERCIEMLNICGEKCNICIVRS